jgi:hypothetical protein
VSGQVVWFQEVFPKEQNVVDNMLEILLDIYAGLKQNQVSIL